MEVVQTVGGGVASNGHTTTEIQSLGDVLNEAWAERGCGSSRSAQGKKGRTENGLAQCGRILEYPREVSRIDG